MRPAALVFERAPTDVYSGMRKSLLPICLCLGACASQGTSRPSPHKAPLAQADQTSSTATTTSSKAASADPCPSPQLPVDQERCAALPADHGLVATRPLEWGLAGSKSFFFGRAVCEGGGWPQFFRQGSVGAARQPSSSPASGVPSFGADILDAYSVTCPNRVSLTVYANMYRCGDPCPPRGFWFVSPARNAAYQASSAAAKAGRIDEAIDLAKAGFPQDALTEREASWLGVLYMMDNRIDASTAAFTTAHQIHPNNPYHLLHRGQAQRKRGDLKAYFQDLLAALEAAGPKHALRPELLCRSQSYWQQQGDKDKAAQVAAESCALGFKRCCPASS